MAARDRFTSEICRPECRQTGMLHLSEDDYPFMKKLHREVDGVEGEFSAKATEGATVELICLSCKATFQI